MNCSRWLTAAFIASADCSTSATISSLLLNSRPTSAMPAISGPLMMSSGAAPSCALQIEIGDQAVFGAFDDVVAPGARRAAGPASSALSFSPAPRKCSVMAAMWN